MHPTVHSCGFSPLRVSMCWIMWLQNSWICLDSLHCVFCCDILWKSCPGCTYGPWELKKIKQGQDDHLWVENWVYTLHWEHPWRRNDKGSLSEDVGRLIQWNYVLVWHILKSRWVKNCKYPVKKIYCISIILKLVQFKPWYGGVAPEIYSWINFLASLTLNDDTSTYST